MTGGQMPGKLKLYLDLIAQTSSRQLAYRARRILRRLLLDRLFRPFKAPANSTKALGAFLLHVERLKDAGKHYQLNRLEQARDEISRALPTIVKSSWPYNSTFWQDTATSLRDTHANLAAALREEAEHSLKRLFVSEGSDPLQLESPINWDPPEFSHCEKTYALNRLYHLPVLALMALTDQDRRFSDEVKSLIFQWLQTNSVQTGKPWNELTTALRLNHVLLAWAMLRDTNLVDAELHEAVLMILVSHARFLMSHLEFDILNNHLVFEARTLLMASRLFPDHPESKRWYHTSIEILGSELDHEVREDGTHAEQSAGYHMQVLLEYLTSLHILNDCHIPAPKGWHDRLTAMSHCLADMLRPDGTPPLSGDTALHDPQTPYADEVLFVAEEVLGLDPLCIGGKPRIRSLLLLGPRLRQIEGPLKSTNKKSVIREKGGQVVLKSRDEQSALSLVIDAGPFAMPDSPAHGHADALHLELSIGDTPILVDPGAYTYEPGLWRDHFRGSQAHNTISADGLDQNILWGAFRCYKPVDGHLLDFDLDGTIQWAKTEVTHSTSQLVHRRLVVLLPESLLLIVDDVASRNVRELTNSFQFAPLTLESIPAVQPSWMAGRSKDQLLITFLSLADDKIDLVSGQHRPPRGWISSAKGSMQAAPQISWRRKATGNDRMITVMCPQYLDTEIAIPEVSLQNQDVVIQHRSRRTRINPAYPAGVSQC